VPTTTLEPGQRATLSRITEQDSEVLRYLAGHGLVPGVEVRVVERAPFDGPITVARAGVASAAPVALAFTLAEAMQAEPRDG
jgi:DtxR family transcriptional regulator, Mn-dependent transcriptional regulator